MSLIYEATTDAQIAACFRAVAGYRISEWLAGGRYLEIEDLVTAKGMSIEAHYFSINVPPGNE